MRKRLQKRSEHDATLHFRVPSSMVVAVHKQAQERGLTISSWVRYLLLREMKTTYAPFKVEEYLTSPEIRIEYEKALAEDKP